MFEFECKAIIITTVAKRRGYGAVFVAPFPVETSPWGCDNDGTRYYTKVKAISNNTIEWYGYGSQLWALNEKQRTYSYVCLDY